MAVLTQRDVARLLKEHSVAARAETAAKIGAEFSGGTMDSPARAIAEEIFRMMLRDAEMRVRKELSESLKHSSLVPHAGARATPNATTFSTTRAKRQRPALATFGLEASWRLAINCVE